MMNFLISAVITTLPSAWATPAGQVATGHQLPDSGIDYPRELTKRAWEKDVQVMIEGPGHMALNSCA